ncbi:juvenile hormone acid O-methyltransferase-like [Contarinia nasturtii]|uniref:juvenile hormone acid O-methyltransferase-like n=1 Tax=Contarinia nasturtii TaxID=265458 RepID=UPI0012D3AFDD|nr:juvenile hormone acid O-methyltransferase-like [Contarinia nasturtii]
MNNAALYQRSNGLQRYDVQQVLKFFSHVLKWRPDGCDSLLDIGCGSGDVTIDFILPILPKNFKRLVAVDLSNDMIQYARENYILPNIFFNQFDLGTDVDKQSLREIEKFDHITSFFCLNWVKNQQTAVRNFYKLLKPGGDFLVLFVAYHPIYDFYKKQSKSKRWSEYMADVDEFISPYQYSENPAIEFRDLLTECGFSKVNVETLEKCYTFNGSEARNAFNSLNPFIDRIPAENRQEYLDELMNLFVDAGFAIDEDNKTRRFAPMYKLVVAYGTK